jgi:hypothetical protein
MRVSRVIAVACYGSLVAAGASFVLAWGVDPELDGAGEVFVGIGLWALLACAVLAWTGVAAAFRLRDLVTGVACALPAALSVLSAIWFITRDWE